MCSFEINLRTVNYMPFYKIFHISQTKYHFASQSNVCCKINEGILFFRIGFVVCKKENNNKIAVIKVFTCENTCILHVIEKKILDAIKKYCETMHPDSH